MEAELSWALDAKSLFAALLLTLCVSTASFGIATHSIAPGKAERLWMAAHVQLTGLLALGAALWSRYPDAVILILQIAAVVYSALVIQAACIILGATRPRTFVRGVQFVLPLLLVLAWYRDLPFNIRAMLVSAGIALSLLPGAWVLLAGAGRSEAARIALGVLSGCGGLAFLLRFAIGAFVPIQSPLESSSVQTLTLLFAIATVHSAGVMSALLMRERTVLRLEDEATHDPLTRVFNRRAFLPLAAGALARLQRVDRHVGLLMIDIDHFKRFNDLYGHAAGDRVLTAVVECSAASLRPSDVLARWGGEEFAVLLGDIVAPGEASAVAERIRSAVESLECHFKGQRLRCTVSVGVALTASAIRLETLIAASDEALYRAKSAGRNRVEAIELASEAPPPAPRGPR